MHNAVPWCYKLLGGTLILYPIESHFTLYRHIKICIWRLRSREGLIPSLKSKISRISPLQA